MARLDISANGVLVAYSTAPGQVAFDGDAAARNSPFTAALLRHIESPGLEVRSLLGRVTKDVVDETHGRQRPWQNSSLEGDFYFAEPQAPAASADTKPPDNAELVFWETIKASSDPADYRAYLSHFPNGVFADLAKAALARLKSAAPAPAATVAEADDGVPIADLGLLKETRERLYELNFDPGPFEGPDNEATRAAVREFARQNNLPATTVASMGLLRRLRAIGSLKPWGAIVYGRDSEKWGMSWGEETRQGAVARAQASCGGPKGCPVEVGFFGGECGAFAHSGTNWAIVARDAVAAAKEAALADCRKGGKPCEIIASVCASGAERFSAAK